VTEQDKRSEIQASGSRVTDMKKAYYLVALACVVLLTTTSSTQPQQNPRDLTVFGFDEKPFPLRTDAPPTEWKTDAMNAGLPYYWEKGTVHVLAWEVIEDRCIDRKAVMTQVLVLKRFDQPTERGGYRWVLAQIYFDPDNKQFPWDRPMIILPPVRPNEKMPMVPDAYVFGYEFYKEQPTDKQIETFLREVCWTPRLGPYHASTITGGRIVNSRWVKSVAAGGVDPILWKRLFGRDLATDLFPELKRASEGER
jgi:hypothetical protein